MPRIKHFIVLMLENRSFDHLFGFFRRPAGETIENLLALRSSAVKLLDPSKPESADNPPFEASQPALFAVDDKEGPSHSFNSVNVQVSNNSRGPSDTLPIQNSASRATMPTTSSHGCAWWSESTFNRSCSVSLRISLLP
jgi:phospholipase C